MKPAVISHSILRSSVPGLVLAMPPGTAAAGLTNCQGPNPAGENDAVFPSALRPDFSRCVAVDPLTGRVFVSIKSPFGNSVLRFASEAAVQAGEEPEAVFNLPALSMGKGLPNKAISAEAPALACDAAGRLWVADTRHHRVLRFDDAGALPSGATPSGVLGQADFTGHRAGPAASQMNGPGDIAVDACGRLYVADTGNARVLWFHNAARRTNGAAANGAIGQVDFELTARGGDGLIRPVRLAVEGGGRGVPATLWVMDSQRPAVLKFDNARTLPMTGALPSAVFGGGKVALE